MCYHVWLHTPQSFLEGTKYNCELMILIWLCKVILLRGSIIFVFIWVLNLCCHVTGCPMGEVVTQLVPYNSYVKIPKAPLDGSTDDCYVMCRCGQHGRVYQCTENVICVKKDAKQCLLKSGMIHSQFLTYFLVVSRFFWTV